MASPEVTEALRELARLRNGEITPDEVVTIAKDKASPLHAEFEWDNRIAGHAYRLQQARALIGSVKLEITAHEYSFKAPPEFVRDPRKNVTGEQGYISLPRVRSDTDMAREVLISEFSRAGAALARAKAIASVLDMGAEAERLHREVMDAHDRVAAYSAS
jgi:hypothetical protein